MQMVVGPQWCCSVEYAVRAMVVKVRHVLDQHLQ
jgi:hypothetical protein